MIPWLADENLNGKLLRALYRVRPGIDLLRVQDVGLSGAADPDVLAWAAAEARVLLTHDAATVAYHAFARVDQGYSLAGVFIVGQDLPFGSVLDDIVLIDSLSEQEEWLGRVVYLPL